MRKFFEWVTAHPWLVIAACLVATIGMGFGLARLKVEAEVANMLPVGQASVEHARMIDDVFEIEDSVVIAVVNEGKEGVYAAHTLKLIDRITRNLKEIRGIDPDKVWSIFTVSNIVGDEGGFSVVPLCEQLPQSSAEVAALKERVKANDMYYGTLVSKSETGTLVYAGVTPAADAAQVYYDVRDMLDATEKQGEDFYVTGSPVIRGVIGLHVGEDMSKMMPLVSIVIVLMLLLIFRSFRGVLLPLTVVTFSVIWTMGLMAFLGIPIYPMTTIVPIVIMAIGVADGIHVITRYYEGARAYPKRNSREVTINAMMEMWSPVVMTSLTTAVGFLSLLTSTMKPIFYTGVFTSFGVLVAMVFSLTLLPASLSVMKARVAGNAKRRRAWADTVFAGLGGVVFKFRSLVMVAGLALAALSLAGLWLVNVDSDPMANFNQTDPIPISTKLINKMFGGAMVVHTTLESEKEKRFLDPEALRAVERYQQEVAKLPQVGATDSVIDFLKMMHMAMNGNDPAYDVVPHTRNLVGTYLMLYSGDNINHYINYTRDKINIQTRVATTSTKVLESVLAKMEKLGEQHLNGIPDTKVVIGGIGRVVVDLINVIVYGQVYSILLAIFGVFLITSIMFHSPVAGLFNIIPISMATALNFGIMGLLKIPLEPATAITSCVGIGVGIDYAIHFIAKYRLNCHQGFTGRDLVEESMATAGKAVFFNAAVVIGGFLVLGASQFPPSRHMGVMISLNMFTSFAAAVTVLPALLVWLDPAFCRRETATIKQMEMDASEDSGGL